VSAAWSPAEFEQQLRERGRSYHIHHPFNVMLNSGRATPEQIRGWVANRFYYQINIPVKDAAILANCDDRAVRRNWVQRILDHDGYGDDPGGIESWLHLAQAAGLARAAVESLSQVLPGVRCSRPRFTSSVSPVGPSTTRGSSRPDCITSRAV
jgi:pyrroloquinoline-quinone synthase